MIFLFTLAVKYTWFIFTTNYKYVSWKMQNSVYLRKFVGCIFTL